MENTDNNENRELEQDMEQTGVPMGSIFVIHLLMEEPCEMPDKDFALSIMKKHLGDVESFSYDDSGAGFAAKRYSVHFEKENRDIPPMLMFTKAVEIVNPVMDEIDQSQTWDCDEADEILASCKYQALANDMMAAGLHYMDRAEMLIDYIEALMEIYPQCKAVVFETSKKMFTRDAILGCKMPKEAKFIYYAVNVRFFRITGTEDMVVDTVGMSTLFMPDLQYHFHGMDPNWVVNHAYNFLSYMFDHENPIKDNDHIDGIEDGKISRDIRWNVRYEGALIKPMREVIDVNMNEYAAGNRG